MLVALITHRCGACERLQEIRQTIAVCCDYIYYTMHILFWGCFKTQSRTYFIIFNQKFLTANYWGDIGFILRNRYPTEFKRYSLACKNIHDTKLC